MSIHSIMVRLSSSVKVLTAGCGRLKAPTGLPNIAAASGLVRAAQGVT
jgi:hypothetical protein